MGIIYFYFNDDYIGKYPNSWYNINDEYFEKLGFIINGEKLRCYDAYNENRDYSNYRVMIQHFNLRKINEDDNDIRNYHDYILEK